MPDLENLYNLSNQFWDNSENAKFSDQCLFKADQLCIVHVESMRVNCKGQTEVQKLVDMGLLGFP